MYKSDNLIACHLHTCQHLPEAVTSRQRTQLSAHKRYFWRQGRHHEAQMSQEDKWHSRSIIIHLLKTHPRGGHQLAASTNLRPPPRLPGPLLSPRGVRGRGRFLPNASHRLRNCMHWQSVLEN